MKRDMLEDEYDNTRCDDEDAIVEKQLIIPPQTFMRRHNKDIYNIDATRSYYIADNIRSIFPYLNKLIYYIPNDEKYPEIPWTHLMLIYDDTSIDEGERFVIEYIEFELRIKRICIKISVE